MDSCSFTDLRSHLRERLDEVHASRAPLLVTRQNAPSAVLLDKDEYDSIMETLHLLRGPANATRLLDSIAQAEAGQLATGALIEP
ncbi:MAG: type II toxin-antitoxin system prevent-host-death family antitoxin [Alphaproteobacteria bacterium]|nr:type II toxin-antitoxin system prevent-host-death family antitoxin [Alphaproteobacteria bacterium]